MLKNRGPDSFEILKIAINEFTLIAAVSVLSLRGSQASQVTKQPLHDQTNGNLLLWNGELFASSLVQVEPNENDGYKIFLKLNEAHSQKDVLNTLESIKGPFAFVYYEKKSNHVYFGRDRLGRRSLLINSDSDGSSPLLILTSVQIGLKDFKFVNEFNEIKASAMYSFDLNKLPICLNLHFWKKINETNIVMNDEQLQENFPYNVQLCVAESSLTDSISEFNENFNILKDETKFQQLIENLYEKLKESVMRRVRNIPSYCKQCYQLNHMKFAADHSFRCEHSKVAVLFSGGVDSAVLAAMVDLCLPADESIDLLNIAFEKQKKTNENNTLKEEFLVPDRISGLESLKELNPARKWNFVEINVKLDELRLLVLFFIFLL